MKNRKWVLGLALMVVTATLAFAQKYDKESDFVVTKSGKGVIITGYKGKNKDVQIPPKIQGKPVIGVYGSNGSEALGVFQNKGLTSVTIPDSVTSIGVAAFRGNQITSVVIPNSVTSIGDGAFAVNQLTSVTIPNSVKTIGKEAFAGNQLTSVTIPDNVTTIGAEAFAGNQLTSVTIPDSVKTIGKEAFGNAKVTLRQRESDFRVRVSDNGVIITGYTGKNRDVRIPLEIQGKSVIGIDKEAFKKKDLSSVIIPDSVITIGGEAFMQSGLRGVTIGNSVTTIGEGAFCFNSLVWVTIPDSVTSIGKQAFDWNPLTDITIGANVSIHAQAFDTDLRFVDVYNHNGLKAAGTYKFDFINRKWTVHLR